MYCRLGSIEIGPPEWVPVVHADGRKDIVLWKDLPSLLKRAPETTFVDHRTMLVDPESKEPPEVASVVADYRKATGYELSVRQAIALWNMDAAAVWITIGLLGDYALPVIFHELRAFLEEAGLRGPRYEIPETQSEAAGVLYGAWQAYHQALAWVQGEPPAAHAAFRLARFIGEFAERVGQMAMRRDSHAKKNRQRGADTNKENAESRRDRWVRDVRALREKYEQLSVRAACFRVADNQDPPVNRRTVYDTVRPRLKLENS